MPGIPRELAVPPDAAGERLDRFLAVPLGSRAQAQRLIGAGLVTVDGAARPGRHRLAGGERVVVAPEPSPPPPQGAPAAFRVVYEDGALLVVDKPAGVVVHPAPGHRGGTLAQALAASRKAGSSAKTLRR